MTAVRYVHHTVPYHPRGSPRRHAFKPSPAASARPDTWPWGVGGGYGACGPTCVVKVVREDVARSTSGRAPSEADSAAHDMIPGTKSQLAHAKCPGDEKSGRYEAPARESDGRQWHHWSGGRRTSSLHLGRHQRHHRRHLGRDHRRHHQWHHRPQTISMRSHASPGPWLRICTLRSSWQDCEDLEPKCLRIERSNMQWSKTWRIYVCVALCCVVLRCLTLFYNTLRHLALRCGTVCCITSNQVT